MAVFKCKMCGGALEINENQTVVTCIYCGSQQTLPKIDDEKKLALFNRANNLRFKSEFDKAAGIYESIVSEFPDEAEAYWGLVLCKYGIEYVDDPADAKKIPTCHRTLPTSIMKDEDFQQACENADISAKMLYREEAKVIDGIQKKILEIANTEEPYDIFICYKENDDITGTRTEDSSMAQDIYTAFTEMGYKVFYARNSLRKVAGTEYEPYIYSALSSAKVMLAIGSKYEYYDAVWVKNEWSRYLSMMAEDKTKHLIPCFKNMDAYDIPEEFSNMQALDMSDMMFFNSLETSIKRILVANKTSTKKTYNSKSNNNSRELAFEDGYYVGESIADQPNGFGTRVWSDGSKYEGEWKYGKQDGQGTITNTDGSSWTGEFKNGKEWTGKGTFYLTDGSKYVGDIVNAKREGKGELYCANGDVYDGKFEDDEFEGDGTYTYKDGSIWAGEFIVGKRLNGKGVAYYENGDKYEGEIVYGKREGQGTLTRKDGSTWIGEFKDGKEWTGIGLVFYKNGEKYEGKLVDGKSVGQGTYWFADGKKYIGEFVNSVCTGKGKLYWPNGDRYEGQFVNGIREGQGTYIYSDGGTWIGEFKNNSSWNGKGTLHFVNGTKYDGDLANGKVHGQGTFTHKNGSTWTGEFKEGSPWNGEGTWYKKDGSYIKGKIRKGAPTVFGSTYFPK